MFEGEGEGGDVGGNGRIDASSSASACIDGDHIDPGPSEGDKDRERTLVPSLTLVSPSASPVVVPLRLFLLLAGPTERGRGYLGPGSRPRSTPGACGGIGFRPASLRWNQFIMGLLALRLTFFPSAGDADGTGVGTEALEGELLGDEVFCG